jgi:hypothetical protein
MLQKERNYFLLIVIHILLGVIVYSNTKLSVLYAILIFLVSFYFVIKTKNKNNEVLYAAAYIVGAEVFLRMTEGGILYEYGKYGVIIFTVLGMFYSGFSKNAVSYWVYLLLLIPGVFIALETLNFGTEIRKTIIFNILGPVSLGIASLYTYNRKISISELNNILLMIGLPAISCAVYITLYIPELKSVITGNASNLATSGGFGPNQVATILGLGMFVFFSRLLFASSTRLLFVINLVLGLLMTYRGLVTFSRGGMITGFIMFVILSCFVYFYSKQKLKLNYFFGIFITAFLLIFGFSEYQTGGLMSKRYANQDAMGRTKESNLSGREVIAEFEINSFLEHPFFGIGVAKGLELRRDVTGDSIASHNEITRMMAEHGAFGILALLILLFTPIFLFLDNKRHIYMASFLLFWILTINHAAMRIAAPSFVYALSLLKVNFDE